MKKPQDNETSYFQAKKNESLVWKITFGTTRGHIFLLALGTWGARRPNLAQLLEYYTKLPLFSDQVYITD